MKILNRWTDAVLWEGEAGSVKDAVYAAMKAGSSRFKLSVRNSSYNEIIAAILVSDEGQIIARLADRKKFRREWTAAWRKIRKKT